MSIAHLTAAEMLLLSRSWLAPASPVRRSLESLPETAALVSRLTSASEALLAALLSGQPEAVEGERRTWAKTVAALTTALLVGRLGQADLDKVFGPLRHAERVARRRNRAVRERLAA